MPHEGYTNSTASQHFIARKIDGMFIVINRKTSEVMRTGISNKPAAIFAVMEEEAKLGRK